MQSEMTYKNKENIGPCLCEINCTCHFLMQRSYCEVEAPETRQPQNQHPQNLAEKKLRSPEGTDVNEVSVRSTPRPMSMGHRSRSKDQNLA